MGSESPVLTRPVPTSRRGNNGTSQNVNQSARKRAILDCRTMIRATWFGSRKSACAHSRPKRSKTFFRESRESYDVAVGGRSPSLQVAWGRFSPMRSGYGRQFAVFRCAVDRFLHFVLNPGCARAARRLSLEHAPTGGCLYARTGAQEWDRLGN